MRRIKGISAMFMAVAAAALVACARRGNVEFPQLETRMHQLPNGTGRPAFIEAPQILTDIMNVCFNMETERPWAACPIQRPCVLSAGCG